MSALPFLLIVFYIFRITTNSIDDHISITIIVFCVLYLTIALITITTIVIIIATIVMIIMIIK